MQHRYHENDITTWDIYRVRKVLQNRMLLTQWSGLEFIRFLFPLPFPRFEESTEGREFAFSFQGRRSRARAQTVRPQSSAILLFRCNKKRQLHVDLCSTHCARDIRNGVARSRENHDACWSCVLLLANDTRSTEIYPSQLRNVRGHVLSTSDTLSSFTAFPAKRTCAQFPMLSAFTDQGYGVSTLLSMSARVETSERLPIERTFYLDKISF